MTRIAELKHFPAEGKWKAFLGDVMLCQSQKRDRVITLIRTGQCPKARRYNVTEVSEHVSGAISAAKTTAAVAARVLPVLNTGEHIHFAPPKPEFSVEEKFQFLTDYTHMIINQEIVSLMVSGSAGCGKTHTINQCFKAHGIPITVVEETLAANNASKQESDDGELTDTDEKETVEPVTDNCVLVKGYTTAKFLYKILYLCRNGLVIFDDADKIIEDKTAINILKGALDSYEKRVVTWGAAGTVDDGLPRSFEFNGGVIVITNKPLISIDKANRSRAALMDITLTTDDFIDLTEQNMSHMCLELPIIQRREVLEFIKEHKDRCADYNLRTYQLLCKIRKSKPNNWKRQALYSLTLA